MKSKDETKVEYKKYLSICEKEFEKTRLALEKKMKPIVKESALALGIDITSTQHSCYPKDMCTSDFYGSDVEKFVDFVHALSDEYKIEFLFEVEKGKFKWF